jgi:hypothetical protein
MLLLCHGDEEFSKPIWLARAFLEPNFVTTSPHFCQIQVEISVVVKGMWTSSTITLHKTPKNPSKWIVD